MTKILLISSEFPFPSHSGGTIKTAKMVEFLSKHYALTLICNLKNDEQISAIQSFTLNNVELITFVNKKQRSIINYLQSIFTTLNIFRNFDTHFKQKVQAIAFQFPCIIVDHYEVFQYVPKNYKGKIIFHTHNAEFILWKRFARLEMHPIKKVLLAIEWRKIRYFESKYLAKADLIWAAPNDIISFQQIQPKRNYSSTYHLGDDELIDLPNLDFEKTTREIMFLGTLSWEPNIMAVKWFVNEVFPIICKEFHDIKFFVVGKNPSNELIALSKNNPNVILTGFVENLEEIYQRVRLNVIPIQFGGGIKVKTLNALYRRIPTVSTSLGIEGLSIQHKKEMLIAETPQDFANACILLLKNKDLCNELSNNAALLAKQYTWKNLLNRHLNEIKTLIA
jgi:glycosyltransferase involved in cell wall biosynthesis